MDQSNGFRDLQPLTSYQAPGREPVLPSFPPCPCPGAGFLFWFLAGLHRRYINPSTLDFSYPSNIATFFELMEARLELLVFYSILIRFVRQPGRIYSPSFLSLFLMNDLLVFLLPSLGFETAPPLKVPPRYKAWMGFLAVSTFPGCRRHDDPAPPATRIHFETGVFF